MKSTQSTEAAKESSKVPTGIAGFDEITRGGLPRTGYAGSCARRTTIGCRSRATS